MLGYCNGYQDQKWEICGGLEVGVPFVFKEQNRTESSEVFTSRCKTGRNTNSSLPSAGELGHLDLIVLMKLWLITVICSCLE